MIAYLQDLYSYRLYIVITWLWKQLLRRRETT